MRNFSLSILDAGGGAREFDVLATDRQALDDRIEQEGWIVLRIRARRAAVFKLQDQDLVLLCQQLELMLAAGLSVHESLIALTDESESNELRALCQLAADYIDSGETLSQAFTQLGIDRLCVSLIRTGEKTGQLHQMLLRAADSIAWRESLKRQLIAELSYPLAIVSLLLVVVPLLFVYLVPQLLVFLDQQNSALPWYTQLLIGTAEAVQRFGLVFLVALIAAGAVGAAVWFLSGQFRRGCHRYLLSFPLLGPLLMQLCTAQISEQTGVMYGAGIPLTEALPLVAKSLKNEYLSERVTMAAQSLSEGNSLHASFVTVGLPATFLRLVRVGEISGSLDKTLAQAARLYSDRARRRAERLARIAGPLALLSAGLVICWIVAALILPLYDGLFKMSGSW